MKYDYEMSWKIWKIFYYHPTLNRGDYKPWEIVSLFDYLVNVKKMCIFDAIHYINSSNHDGKYLCQEYKTIEYIPRMACTSFKVEETIHDWYTNYCEYYRTIMDPEGKL
jgi:hypothetical protein